MTTDPTPNVIELRRLIESASDNNLPVIATANRRESPFLSGVRVLVMAQSG